ncbi:endonuclease domain-containing 1 protein-like [Megalobrama amblycephala]|uniref:endonuclease domain-containing 1 protein-like n=1 Tax=Megalobrama amblycephala TaxID=75352 RepID=UPI0020141FC6|nr:endonuclease domain-containing 1 protein-like [Megalobrama amblycephala]
MITETNDFDATLPFCYLAKRPRQPKRNMWWIKFVSPDSEHFLKSRSFFSLVVRPELCRILRRSVINFLQVENHQQPLLKNHSTSQTLNGVVYFATYYDTDNKIPVYSAYRFAGIKGCTRLNNWYIEPQLDDDKGGPNMATEGTIKDINLRGKHQALSKDYGNSGYDKGHLEPVFQAESQSCADATFTLTNAAPQDPSFNISEWKKLEGNNARYLKQCLDNNYSVFIVTGVVPGPEKTLKENVNVNVPSHFWTAYCCLDQNNRCQFSDGFIGENKKSTPNKMTVNDLETMLSGLYNVNHFKVFNVSE